MRLIDADKFAVEEPKLWDWSSVDGISSTAVLKQCIWDVQCAPVVDAIPIEFIEKYLEKWKHAETYDIVHSWWLIIKRDWEKENEDTCMQLRQR